MPGDKIGSIRGKKNGGALQVMVAAKAAKRNFLQKGVPIPFDHHLGHTRGKPPRGDGVHLDVVNAPLTGQILGKGDDRSEEHTSELQSRFDLVCRLLLEKKKKKQSQQLHTLNESNT